MLRYWLDLGLVALLMVVNAIFAGSEVALLSVREGQLRQMEKEGGSSARAVALLTRDPNRFLATVQIGITGAGYLASATAAVTLATPLAPLFGFLGGAAEGVAIAAVTLVLVFVNLVIGELAPKRLAMQHAQAWALVAARPLAAMAALSRPVVWGLSRTTNGIVRILGGDPEQTGEQLTAEELHDLVASHRGLDREQRTIISGALEIHRRMLREVLVPRRAVFTLAAETPLGQARRSLAASGHSRAPVVRSGHLDDVAGIAHLRDLLTDDGTVADAISPVLVFPDSLHVSDALQRFKAERQQFALVADEDGATAGIITLEDLLEEIVGEIYDETDHDIATIRTMPDGSLLLPGTFPVHDLPDIGVQVEKTPRTTYNTVAGLILARLGRIPDEPGDTVQLGDRTAEVTQVARHAITEVRLSRR